MARSIFSAAFLEKARHDKGLAQALAEVEDDILRRRDARDRADGIRAVVLFGLYLAATLVGAWKFGDAGLLITTCGLPIAYVLVTEAWWWIEDRIDLPR